VRARLAAGLALAALAAGFAVGGAGAAPSAVAVSERLVIGKSVRGKPIKAAQIGDPVGERVVLVVGVIHGDERAGLRIVEALRRRISDPATLQGTELWLVPSVNPDGLRMHTRKNARGVDLNRNFPFRWRGGVPRSSGYYPGPRPASEPETKAVMAFARRIQPDLSVWYHQPWGAVLACHGRPQLGAEYANLVGMRTSCRGKGLRGTAISWEAHSFRGSTAFVVELGAGGISQRGADRHARAVLSLAGNG
jgi:murein peptide amidase A